MKVIYRDPDGRAGTYHPVLGYLEAGKPFDLPANVAQVYLDSGLLQKVEKTKKEVKTDDCDNG